MAGPGGGPSRRRWARHPAFLSGSNTNIILVATPNLVKVARLVKGDISVATRPFHNGRFSCWELCPTLLTVASRNCTKHQVRCDYMDGPTPGDDSLRLSGQPNLLWTSEIDRNVELWRQTGQFPFPDLHVFPQPQWQTLSKTELRLIYHVASVCYEMQSSRTSQLTIWAETMPK